MLVTAELHCHTRLSDGFSSVEGCVQVAARRGLSVLAITDHNTAAGGMPFWDEPIQTGVLVIPGEEISTELGHVLAYFVKETIPAGPFLQVIAAIRAQGALAFMAHPYHIPLGNTWRKKRLSKLLPEHLALLDGVEVQNGHNRAQANRMAWQLAEQPAPPGATSGATPGTPRRLAAISGSDAHLPWEIGNAITRLELPELSYAAARHALANGCTRPEPRRVNTYALYLAIGLLNRLQKRHYAWKAQGQSKEK